MALWGRRGRWSSSNSPYRCLSLAPLSWADWSWRRAYASWKTWLSLPSPAIHSGPASEFWWKGTTFLCSVRGEGNIKQNIRKHVKHSKSVATFVSCVCTWKQYIVMLRGMTKEGLTLACVSHFSWDYGLLKPNSEVHMITFQAVFCLCNILFGSCTQAASLPAWLTKIFPKQNFLPSEEWKIKSD